MKLIALRDFRNIGGAIEIKDARHDLHIHKGAIFTIGQGDDLVAMKRLDRDSVELIGRLSMAGCIGDATDAVLCAKVESELLDEARREAAIAARAVRR
ncbi:MAG: hypothetical protein WCQ21_21530 [Verrucomicrobiota bacterium]